MNVWPALLVGLSLGACAKVPLEADTGVIDFASVHWFENEKVAYVFFSLSERTARLVNPQWQLRWTAQSASGGQVEHPFAPVDFTQGVHQHEQMNCAPDRLCASYSFNSDHGLSTATIKFLYDAGSSLALAKDLDVANHPAGNTADAYSALPYGVFDRTNGRLQVRIHHNFGTPQDELVAAYGLTRRFHITGVALLDVDTKTVRDVADKTGSPLLFPAAFCQASQGTGDLQLVGSAAWFSGTLDPAQGAAGACFQAEALDKQGQALPSGIVEAYGRRNPELASPQGPTLQTPLRGVTQLPLVIRVCADDPAAGSLVDQDFFNYQAYVLGMSQRPIDLCFKVGQEAAFAKALSTLLASRLATARAQATDASDYMFVVLLHELFSAEFTIIQASVSSALYSIIQAEANAVSPRLVGAFVYDPNVAYQPNAAQKKALVWCPQSLLPKVLTSDAPLADQNCTITPAGQFDLKVINFVAPLGPLPSIAQYHEYVKKYGDKGLAKSPTLSFFSVPSGPTTISEAGSRVTYFDHERYVIGKGEAARMCPDREDASLSSFRIRTSSQADSIPGTSVDTINKLWLSDKAEGEYRIGIGWTYPFWGGIGYKAALNGKVVSVVPYTKSASAYEALGDAKWTTDHWNFGQYTQHCYRYCDNPFFDAAGTYQSQQTWRTFQEATCPNPAYPQPPSGGAS